MKVYLFCISMIAVLFAAPVWAKSKQLPTSPQQAAERQRVAALENAGETDLDAGNFVAAEADFRAALASQEWNRADYYGLARSLAAQRRIEEAIQSYQTLFYDMPINSGIRSNKPEEIQDYRFLVYKDPMRFSFGSDTLPAMMNYAILLSQAKQWNEAVMVYENALPHIQGGVLPHVDVHFDPSVPMPEQLQAMAHVALGIYFGFHCDFRGDPEDKRAINEYKQAMRLQPNSALVNFYYGYGLQRMSHNPQTMSQVDAQARAAFKKASELDSGIVGKAADKALTGYSTSCKENDVQDR